MFVGKDSRVQPEHEVARGVFSSLEQVLGIGIGVAEVTGCIVCGESLVRVPQWTVMISGVRLVSRLVERMKPISFECPSNLQSLGGWGVAAKIVEAVEETSIDQEVSARTFTYLGVEGAACVGIDYGRWYLFADIRRAAARMTGDRVVGGREGL